MHDLLVAETYFDGDKYHADGPYTIQVDAGRVTAITSQLHAAVGQQAPRSGTGQAKRVPFAMPGLVEAHAHIFLDGAVLDLAARSEFLTAPFASMIEVARRNLRNALFHGVTLIRDAGDRYGVNHAARSACRQAAEGYFPDLRSAGLGIRRPARYGSFMAYDAAADGDIVSTVERIASEGADDLKIILTGIIDFASGQVKGEPQFDEQALSLIVKTARARGLRTFAHCSGLAGLEVAVAAGVDSVEHGFFMTAPILQRMRDQQIAWVPTFSPVHFQWKNPGIVGWDANTVGHLRRILDAHLEHVRMAHELGVPLLAGSDAGSQGVCHGVALIDELFFLLEAGLPMDAALTCASARPRRLWGSGQARLAPGAAADIICLAGDPFDDAAHLRRIAEVFKAGVPGGAGEARGAHAYA